MNVAINDYMVQDNIFIISSLQEFLLGRPAFKALHIVKYLREVPSTPEGVGSEASILESYLEHLSGLGLMETLYRVVFILGVKPHVITYP